jgi:phage gpG-like protein
MLRRLNDEAIADEKREESKEIAALVRDQVIENFYSESDSDGNSWLPRKGNPAHLPLRLSWRMFAAGTVKGAPGSIEEITNEEILVGINGSVVKYAAVQQFGTRDGRVPAREYYYVKIEDLVKLEPPIHDALMRILDHQVSLVQAA